MTALTQTYDTQPQTIFGGLRLLFVPAASAPQMKTAACHFSDLGVKYI